MRATAPWLLLIMTTICACPRRSDFVPPPAPVPIRAEPVLAPPTERLDATTAVQLALERNPTMRGAVARIDDARARLAEAEAALWPRLGIEASYLVGDAPSAYLFKRIDARALPPDVDFNDPGGFENLEGGIALRWNLWNGGRDLLGTWRAESGVAAAHAGRGQIRNDLVAAVLSSYLAARAATALGCADDASIRSITAQVEEASVRVEGGAALRSDLLSLEVRLAEAKQQRLRSGVAEARALASLRALLVLPPTAPLALADTDVEALALPDGDTATLATAYRSRPDVRAARHRVEQAGLATEQARRAYLPRLDVAARLYGDDAGARLDPGDRNWTVAVALSVDLFDGFAREARIRRARAALDAAEARDRELLLEVARQVDVASLDLHESKARLAVASAATRAADESLSIVSVRYAGGAEPITRYLDAEAAAARARSNVIGARSDVDRATVELARVLGHFATADEEETP